MATLTMTVDGLYLALVKPRRQAPAAGPSMAEGRRAFAALAAGDRESLGDLYDLFADELFGFALWLAGNLAEAADVVQEAFVRLLERAGRLERVSNPRGYLLRVTRRVAIDRHRRMRPTVALEVDPLVTATDPDRQLDAERLSRWLRHLRPTQRETLYLRYFCELSYAEIGRITGVPTFTAASRCRLGTARLRRWFDAGRRE